MCLLIICCSNFLFVGSSVAREDPTNARSSLFSQIVSKMFANGYFGKTWEIVYFMNQISLSRKFQSFSYPVLRSSAHGEDHIFVTPPTAPRPSIPGKGNIALYTKYLVAQGK